jgi:hypothetical protein
LKRVKVTRKSADSRAWCGPHLVSSSKRAKGLVLSKASDKVWPKLKIREMGNAFSSRGSGMVGQGGRHVPQEKEKEGESLANLQTRGCGPHLVSSSKRAKGLVLSKASDKVWPKLKIREMGNAFSSRGSGMVGQGGRHVPQEKEKEGESLASLQTRGCGPHLVSSSTRAKGLVLSKASDKVWPKLKIREMGNAFSSRGSDMVGQRGRHVPQEKESKGESIANLT